MTDILNLLPTYNWQLGLIAFVVVATFPHIFAQIVRLIPVFKREYERDNNIYKQKMQNPKYVLNQKKHSLQSSLIWLSSFALIAPFSISADPQPWWHVIRDCFIILMVYDFLYYITHRFLFHDHSLFEGPFKQEHALHHRERNPVTNDVYYVHWVEIVLAQLFFGIGTFLVVYFFGSLHLITAVVAWILHQEIQRHNHAQWEEDRFPFRYAKYVSDLHHRHHERFNSGNFGSISPFFDWAFGTLDHGRNKS